MTTTAFTAYNRESMELVLPEEKQSLSLSVAAPMCPPRHHQHPLRVHRDWREKR